MNVHELHLYIVIVDCLQYVLFVAFTEVIPRGGTVVLAAEEHGPVHVQVGQEVINMLLYHLRII